ncbi:MAG: response regulator [Desulfobacterales bacterium]|nr:MAG: response regulator [Desulfobacterales bacterium]
MDGRNKETILFVDDEESILKVVTEYFERQGYRIFTAGNGVEAMQIIKNEKVDCCFTDINMPVMNGLDLAENIRLHDNTMPVIVMTGYPSLENTIQTIKNGVVDFLIKPVNLKQMELCMQRVLRQRGLFIENVLLKEEVQSKERLENLNQELLYKVEELNILNKIMSNFTSIVSTADVFKRAVDQALEISQADFTNFYVINESVNQPFEVASARANRVQGDNKESPVDPSNLQSMNAAVTGVDPSSLVQLIMEVASDEIPLLISQNNGAAGLPKDLLSVMLVPLKIREKVFGVLTAGILEGLVRFSEKDLYYLSFMAQSAAQSIENLALYENIYENLFATLYAFVNAVEARDLYTRQHSSRVTGISLLIGRQLGCTGEELDILNFAGHLHDIGKIGIRDDILLKPGRLTQEEFEKIKQHPAIGANILEQMGMWDKERQIIRCHHERFDGTGYPDGLKEKQIPFLARILSVADVYDAMASDRAYRKRMEERIILKVIHEGSGTQFDPVVVAAFDEVYKKGIISNYMETGQLENTGRHPLSL